MDALIVCITIAIAFLITGFIGGLLVGYRHTEKIKKAINIARRLDQ